MLENSIRASASKALKELYSAGIPEQDIIVQKTRKDYEDGFKRIENRSVETL